MLLKIPMFAQLASAVETFGMVHSLGVNIVRGAGGGGDLA